MFLPRTPPPELVRQLHPIATDRNPATAWSNRFPHLGETDLFADECIGSLIPSPSPLSFCVPRGTWRRRGIKIRGIFRGSTFMPDWRTGHVSFYLCCQTRNRVGESYARVGLVKGIRIEIRSIDARLVSFDDSFSFCFSPFPLLLFQIILLSEIVRVARIETAAYWSSECSLLQNVLNRSKSFFLCVCFNFLFFFFFVMLCCFGCFCHKKLTREKVENRDRLIGKRNFEEKSEEGIWRGRYSRIKFVKEIVEFRFCL